MGGKLIGADTTNFVFFEQIAMLGTHKIYFEIIPKR